jgi:hypothetical protein
VSGPADVSRSVQSAATAPPVVFFTTTGG